MKYIIAKKGVMEKFYKIAYGIKNIGIKHILAIIRCVIFNTKFSIFVLKNTCKINRVKEIRLK